MFPIKTGNMEKMSILFKRVPEVLDTWCKRNKATEINKKANRLER